MNGAVDCVIILIWQPVRFVVLAAYFFNYTWLMNGAVDCVIIIVRIG